MKNDEHILKGDFGLIYPQFKDKPKLAIKHLMSEADKKVFDSKMFRFVVAIDKKRSKNWLLTAFDIKKRPDK
jgi:hypothetical protein